MLRLKFGAVLRSNRLFLQKIRTTTPPSALNPTLEPRDECDKKNTPRDGSVYLTTVMYSFCFV